MFKNYLKITLRNLSRNKVYSLINITGLSAGMAVAIVIGLWIWDEMSFDKNHENYERIAMIKQHITNNGETTTQSAVPFPLGEELRTTYGSNFKHVTLMGGDGDHVISIGEKKLMQRGLFMEAGGPELLTLKMLKGSREGLNEMSGVLLSASAAKACFGDHDPMNQRLKIDNQLDVQVTGVYEDLPANSSFSALQFIAPWKLFFANTEWIRTAKDPWRPNAFTIIAQLHDQVTMEQASARIKDSKLQKVSKELAKKKPVIFLLPMNKWHLYSDFKNGVNIGGGIKYVWLFGMIGVFVLLLACINFMNLSTARSEKRAKEVGIRKAIGSLRKQLVQQFFLESFLMVFISFLVAMLLVQVALPFFNEVAGKKMSIPWSNPVFWLLVAGFTLLTGLVAGSYPAFYLSSFEPVKILKGTFKVGRWAAIPRRVLVVMQFSVSVTMIIGTIIVFRQVEFTRNRPLGYDNKGVVAVRLLTPEVHDHLEALKNELEKKGTVISVAESGSPLTAGWSSTSGIDWQGKDPNLAVDFSVERISPDFGKTIGWSITGGRDFSRDFGTDSSGLVLNEAAVKFMGLKHPVGETIRWFGDPFKIIGIAKDMVAQSPYEPVRPTIFALSDEAPEFILLKLNPAASPHTAMADIESIFKKFNPAQPFQGWFVDEEYSRKFFDEERIGKLAGFFALLAILISCLGLFGMSSFMAEQRTKEIGVRKVLGASLFNVWRLLSKDFIVLVLISLLIAIPVAGYFMNSWLQNYTYHTNMSWWIFASAGIGALMITLITISFQAIKAAVANPVNSLRTE
ncbi:MAG: ABC transporter permease [Bacteroidota bacterium]